MSNHLLSWVRQRSTSPWNKSSTKSGYNSSLTSHLQVHKSLLITLQPFSSVCWITHAAYMHVYCLSVANMASSGSVLFPQKSIAKLQVISMVAGLGLTSLAFIRNISLSLCWHKSTSVPTGARLIYTRAGSNFNIVFSFCSVLLARTQQQSFLCICFTLCKVS